MESKRLSWAALALLLALLALQEGTYATQPHASAAHRQRRMVRSRRPVKNMVFYMHDLPKAKIPTAVLVAAQNGNLGLPPTKLGATFVFDDKLTAGPDPNSTEIGRGQGVYTLASLTSANLFLTFTAVFHKPAHYSGSTICLLGSDRVFLPEREIGVVGGTGVFRFARGYAILSTSALDFPNAIIKFNLTMLL